MSPLHSLTLKMLKMTYYMLHLVSYSWRYANCQFRWRPYWIFGCKKFCPRVKKL